MGAVIAHLNPNSFRCVSVDPDSPNSRNQTFIFFLITCPQARHLQSKKFNFFLKFCGKNFIYRHYFSPLNTWEKGRIRSRILTSDLWIRIRGAQKHADPGGPKACGSGSPTLRGTGSETLIFDLQIKFLWASEESGFRHLYLVVAALSRDSSPPDSTLQPRSVFYIVLGCGSALI